MIRREPTEDRDFEALGVIPFLWRQDSTTLRAESNKYRYLMLYRDEDMEELLS
jgi:hypothetical protein